MAKKDKLTKSKSIYTIKNRHSITNNGIIYENDHFTIIPNDGIYNEEEGTTIFSESNFKYRVNSNYNSKKKHTRGEFVKQDDLNDVWTLETISGQTATSEESKIILKPNYSSLGDFAYYGSAVELIKATVRDVVERFPGGLYYTNKQITVGGTDRDGKEQRETVYYLVSNEFEIDCWTGGGLISSGTVKNPMRVLAASYMNYETGNGLDCSCPIFTSESTCPNSIIGKVNFGAGDFSVYMNGNGEKYLVTKEKGNGTIIKPKQKFIDEFWDNIDDFERVLLNRGTTPIYKAVFETPYSNENGYYYENKSYIWPTVNNDGVTPDISSGAFQGYLESLLSLAEFHDTYDSDNIWRMMTHESIKNLDWTYMSKKGDEEEDLSDFDATGIGAMMRIYGRQFDDLKRYADNIKSIKTISYDEKNNMPDYFLSDLVEEDGWEAQHTSQFDGEKTETISGNVSTALYADEEKTETISDNVSTILYVGGKTMDFVNSAFQRRLALSSNYIQSLKGTRRGIEAILGMFGYSYDSGSTFDIGTYTISEYVHIFSGLSYEEAIEIRSYHESLYEVDGIPHMMYGYPVALVSGNVSTTLYADEETPETIIGKDFDPYLVPWFNKKEKYDYPFYFQGKGGWGKIKSKPINLSSLTTLSSITSDRVILYGETQPYMKFANNIDEMLMIDIKELYENTICYVTDTSNIKSLYKCGEGEDEDSINGDIHYFSLKNVALSTRCGFVSNDTYNCYGWKAVPSSEISEGKTEDSVRILYLESLIANYKGNNPHVGFGRYDDGEEYINKFTLLFEDLIKEGAFDNLENENKPLYDKIMGFGFKQENIIEDNKKCAYYKDYLSENLLTAIGEEDNISNWNSSQYVSYKLPDTVEDVEGVSDESQANAVMNVKTLIIKFNVGGNEFLKKYIQDVVLKYLEQMIPSTAILEYRFDNDIIIKSNDINYATGSFNIIRTAHAAITKDDPTITVWREYPTPINEM